MISTVKRVSAAIVGVAALYQSVALAGPPANQKDVAALFDLAETNTPTAVTAAKQQYERIKKQAGNDPKLDYAYGLTLLEQHRYRDALPLVSAYLETSPTDLGAQRVKIWALVQDRKFSPALSDALKLSQQIAVGGSEQEETARYLGVLFGYLEVATTQPKDVAAMTSARNQLATTLGRPLVAAFDEGRQAVAARYKEMQDERTALTRQAQGAAVDRAIQDKQVAADDRKRASDEQDSLQHSAERLREAERRLRLAQQQLASSVLDRSRLTATMAAAQAQLQQLMRVETIDRRNGPRQVQGTPTADGSRIFVPGTDFEVTVPTSPTDPRYAQAMTLVASLAALNKQAFDMDRRILELQSTVADLSGTAEGEAEAVDQSQRIVEGAERRADQLERRAKQAQPKTSPRATVLSNQMKALSTYLPLPFEQERDRVLGWFSEKE